MPRRVRRLRERRASIDRTSDAWARSFRQNEFVLCGQAQVIRVVAMKNDNVARADEQANFQAMAEILGWDRNRRKSAVGKFELVASHGAAAHKAGMTEA